MVEIESILELLKEREVAFKVEDIGPYKKVIFFVENPSEGFDYKDLLEKKVLLHCKENNIKVNWHDVNENTRSYIFSDFITFEDAGDDCEVNIRDLICDFRKNYKLVGAKSKKDTSLWGRIKFFFKRPVSVEDQVYEDQIYMAFSKYEKINQG